jgi:hypothetical protein
LLLTGKWHRYGVTVKYADYLADASTPLAIARDTTKFWAQLEYTW